MNRIGRRIILCMLLIAALILVSAPDVLADDLTGQASVIDGDTLEIHGTRIRLWGIDAPRVWSVLSKRERRTVSLPAEGRQRKKRLLS